MMVALGHGGRFELIPFPPERKSIDFGDYHSNYQLIEKELNWTPKINLHEGLNRTVEYYKKQHVHYW
jgi:dTDP-glucose 4,6-dehydratase/UDP-glucose 4-epimerase